MTVLFSLLVEGLIGLGIGWFLGVGTVFILAYMMYRKEKKKKAAQELQDDSSIKGSFDPYAIEEPDEEDMSDGN